MLRKITGTLIFVTLLSACNTIAPINLPIAEVDNNEGYRIKINLDQAEELGKDPETLFVMAFSGGGTRAAAFSYGVLEELKRTQVHSNGRIHSLIDDVNAIGGVSGGSFTALAYAMYGDQLFEQYETQFLKRNVQGTIIKRLFNPKNWSKLASRRYGRAELAAEYYDEILFKNKTYGDLLKDKKTPFIAVSATALSSGARFEFTQDDFDIICSDLSKVKISRAAATSSSVPGVFSPVRLYNYGGTCSRTHPNWVQELVVQHAYDRPPSRLLNRLDDMNDFENRKKRPFLHFVDGGVSDNLGLRGILTGFEEIESSRRMRTESHKNLLSKIKRVVVVVVNARTQKTEYLDQSEKPPNLLFQLIQSSNVPMDRYTYESLAVLNDMVDRWDNKQQLDFLNLRLKGLSKSEAGAQVPKISLHAIDVSFERLRDEKERLYLQNLPTSFKLPSSDVDRLREAGGSVLRDSVVFKNLLQELNSTATATKPETMPALDAVPTVNHIDKGTYE